MLLFLSAGFAFLALLSLSPLQQRRHTFLPGRDRIKNWTSIRHLTAAALLKGSFILIGFHYIGRWTLVVAGSQWWIWIGGACGACAGVRACMQCVWHSGGGGVEGEGLSAGECGGRVVVVVVVALGAAAAAAAAAAAGWRAERTWLVCACMRVCDMKCTCVWVAS